MYSGGRGNKLVVMVMVVMVVEGLGVALLQKLIMQKYKDYKHTKAFKPKLKK